jgi:hypothetical protein
MKWSDIVNPKQVGNLCFRLKASLHYSWSMSVVLGRALSFTHVRICYFSLLIQGWTVLWTEPNNQMLQTSHFFQELREEPWTFHTNLRNVVTPQWSLDPYAQLVPRKKMHACMHASKQAENNNSSMASPSLQPISP